MLISTQIHRTPTVDRLIRIWAQRYLPNLSSLAEHFHGSTNQALQALTSVQGRTATIAKFRKSLVNVTCEMASVKSRGLYEQSANVIDFNEARLLNSYAVEVYTKLLELYLDHGEHHGVRSDASGQHSVNWMAGIVPNVQRVAEILEPALMLFQSQYMGAKDWRTLGSITTQLNFTSALLMPKLTPVEQIMIAPFFRFVEEQIALPWQRVCAAAARYDLDSPEFILVEQMLPDSSNIAEVVYQQMIERFPRHYSRRGGLTHPGITHSCLRDLNMMQAYLWLCLFQGSLKAIEHELVELCIMVLPRVQVQWELIDGFNTLLVEELFRRMNSQQKALLKPYAEELIHIFRRRQAEFEAQPDELDIAKLGALISAKTAL